MSWKINKVKALLESYRPFGIIGIRGIGKTTLVRDIILEYCNDETQGLVIACGKENGCEHIARLNVERAKEWDSEEDEFGNRGLVQVVDDLVATKKENGIKIVCLDTIDELFSMAYNQANEEHRKINGTYSKSVNEMLGGYNAGRKRIIALVETLINELCEAGYAVFWTGHTKLKEKEDIVSGIKYEQITNNLEDGYFGAIADKSQMVVNIVNEFEFENIHEEVNKFEKDKSKNKYDKGSVLGTKRYMYFRNNGFVDAKNNFPCDIEKVEFGAKQFLEMFRLGVEEANKITKLTNVEKEQQKEEEKTINETKVDVLIKKETQGGSEQKDLIVEKLKDLIKEKGATKEKQKIIIDKMKELNISLKSYDNTALAVLKSFGKFLNELVIE